MKLPNLDSDDSEHLTEKNTAVLSPQELVALYSLLTLLFLASIAYIIVKARIYSRRSGVFSLKWEESADPECKSKSSTHF
ncbi:hypothetical protein V3C99_017096 [Haemonchus contortus]|uniref:Cytotoxic and regulatory T-cell molecule n=1 Tax=Haemonchus contortus TaxID=6289 RepID=A0A7I4Z7S1_HAECO